MGAHFGQHENCFKCKSLSPAAKESYNQAQIDLSKEEGDKAREEDARSLAADLLDIQTGGMS